MDFQSILVQGPAPGGDAPREQPACFPDLNLDQVLRALCAGREEYDLGPFFCAPLHDVETVRYRQEVAQDLEARAVRDIVLAFAAQMRTVRVNLGHVEKSHYRRQKQRWFVDAVDAYCAAVRSLAERLAGLELRSRGLQGLREYLTAHVASSAFSALEADTQHLYAALGAVRYCVHIEGRRVTVTRYEGEADYSAEVLQTFERFKRGAVKDHLVKLRDWSEMNHVEANVLDLVAQLHPEPFAELDDFCTRHRDFRDATVRRFDREVQFLLAYLDYIRPLRSAGLPFCYPHVSATARDVSVDEGFDLALAAKLARDGGDPVVTNGFNLRDPERILVVTGPNSGGKTTFARMFGQLPYLASLGLPVPGRRARVFLPDRVFTHFEVEEDVASLHGKLEDELLRIHDILEEATGSSIVVMNESFASTTFGDALRIGTEVLHTLGSLGARCVYVTFVDELASLSERTVSMVGGVDPHDRTRRTFRIERRPADGLAYAIAIARKHQLTYAQLRERLAS